MIAALVLAGAIMEAEFDRLDTKHDGELDAKELAKPRLRPYVGK